MKKKKRDTELEKIFNLIFQEKTENPDDVLRLISKYEKLAATLKSSDSDELDEILIKLSKLKMLLSNLYKKKRQQMLELHWDQIREENDKFLKKLNEQLAAFKERLSGKNILNAKK